MSTGRVVACDERDWAEDAVSIPAMIGTATAAIANAKIVLLPACAGRQFISILRRLLHVLNAPECDSAVRVVGRKITPAGVVALFASIFFCAN